MTRVLVTLITDQQSDEPQILKDAMQRPDWSKWHDVMKRKFNSLVENQTWDLIRRFDTNQQMIIERWTYKLKKNRDENLICYKTRWVAHDFKQRYEMNFDETFASVVKLISYKTLMTISAKRDLQIRHMNVIIAFLYEVLDEDVYVDQSHMFEFERNDDKNLVCKLKKALYELKQASKIWYDIIHKFLIDLDFKRSDSNHAIFIFKTENKTIFLAMYVNDLLLFESNLNDLKIIQNELKKRFKMIDLSQLSHYLEMKIIISSDKNQLILTQSTYMKKVLKQFDMKKCKLVSISIKSSVTNTLISAIEKANDAIIKWYQQLIESLMWSAIHTRSDLTYSVRVLSRYAHNSSQIHCVLIKRVLRYVVEITNVELRFNRDVNNSHLDDDLVSYSDSDFADLKDKRHSTDEYVFMLVDEAISHSSKQQ
jgi:hypothetical protein